MSVLRRWTSQISASFEWLLDQVENHQALVVSAIKEMQEGLAKAQLQLKRVQRDGEELNAHYEQAVRDVELWKERALRFRETQRDKALECVQRHKNAERERDAYAKQIKDHDNLVKQLTNDLKVIKERISGLKQRKNEYAARQTRADAVRVMQREDLDTFREIDDVFFRWESKFSQFEISSTPVDDLEDELLKEETKIELEALLDSFSNNAAQK